MAVIRKRRGSLWGAVRDRPRDWLLGLAEDYELVDWNRVSDATSWPCALALNALFVLVAAARRISAPAGAAGALVDARGAVDEPGVLAGVLLAAHVTMCAASIGNAWWLFSSRRTYQLRMADIDATTALTSNCRRVARRAPRPAWARSLPGRAAWTVWRWVLPAAAPGREDDVWELSMWTPPTFSRNVFCWFSPAQLLVLAAVDGSNWHYILPLAAVVAAQCTHLVFAYTALVRDKQVLFGEVHNEYNQKFVHPRVFAPTQDAATSTADDLAPPRRAAGGWVASSVSVSRARIEELKRASAARRRTADGTEYLSQDARQPRAATTTATTTATTATTGATWDRPAPIVDRARVERLKQSDAARRRTTAFAATDDTEYLPRGTYQRPPRYTSATHSARDKILASYDSATQGAQDRDMAPYGNAARSTRDKVLAPYDIAPAADEHAAPSRMYESRFKPAAGARSGGENRLDEPLAPRPEPIGTYRIRDRTPVRRRHTEIADRYAY
ncbi:hypothetical protein H4R18_002385 [Coemansia javaensis]|uniref:Nuclear rim protein 1 n=1 Tax=Coemansia javaensis TaxID=2761396 RepID=A0A9W8HGV4_9FUNG|nr:hypothetical protein H4R18_002385 [Coemansia javaensis]